MIARTRMRGRERERERERERKKGEGKGQERGMMKRRASSQRQRVCLPLFLGAGDETRGQQEETRLVLKNHGSA